MTGSCIKGNEIINVIQQHTGIPTVVPSLEFVNALHALNAPRVALVSIFSVELNILDYNGAVDLDEKTLSRLDIAIASLHTPCITPGSRKENTRAYCMAMENPYIDILGHPGDPRYDVDYMEVFRVAAETGTLLEINNASLVPGGFRDGSGENIEKLLRLCMENGQHILLGSDAHFYTGIGDVFYAVALLEKIGFPEGLVLNTQPEEIQKHLKHR